MDGTLISEVEMVEWSCAYCGCRMYMPKELNASLQVNHKVFYCVSGHSNIYSKKTSIEEVESKLMNEYSKNAQLEDKIKQLEKGIINRIFNKK